MRGSPPMSNTLIVRDATLAINGASESRIDPHGHLMHRIEEVARMDPASVEACVEVLHSVMGAGDEVNADVLEALTILALAQPEFADRMGMSAISSGRRLAVRKEQGGEAEFAMTVLEVLLDTFPGEPALERDYAALMRRQGMVHDLVQRYLDRADKLLREGKDSEALGWLREALLLDKSRKDVARRIRDLRLQRGRSRSRPRLGPFAATLLLVLGLTGVVYRERQLRSEYQQLPQGQNGDLDALTVRLDALERFVEDHPIWHGSLAAVSERSDLRVEIERLEVAAARRRRIEEERRSNRLEEAALARGRALMRLDSGNLDGALEDFRRALEIAPGDWDMRERTERDIEALIEFRSEKR